MPYSTREKKNAHAREYDRSKAEQRNAYMQGWRKKNYPLLKDRAYRKLGDRCSNPACQWLNADGTRGCTDRRCLQIDHVYGGGSQERKTSTGYIILLRVIEDEDHKYQLLCANCNWIKSGIVTRSPVSAVVPIGGN
jgi:hypothetical protein